MVCQRCIADAEKVSEARVTRWRDIIREAAEQSRRGRLPTLQPVATLVQACESADGLKLLPWEGDAPLSLRSALRKQSGRPQKVSLFIGPEGGFDPAEVEFARSCGVIPVTLGKHTLRAETAALVAASLVLYELGDLGA
ncbi:MAG: RsmE family RNA methyltransferase, partial [Dehalococcoidia bacterium]|nr:RsmE family RNA methyltransferase [Dehalococcoidia bacterium]